MAAQTHIDDGRATTQADASVNGSGAEMEAGDPRSAASPVLGIAGLIDLVVLLARYKRVILWVTAVTAILAGVAAIAIPDRFTATATILPPLAKQSAAVPLTGQLEAVTGLSAGDLGLTNPTDLCMAILTSRSIQNAIVNQFDLRRVYSVRHYEDARKRLDRGSEILADKEGQISISVSDRDAARAAQMANAYVEQLRALYQSLAQAEAKQRQTFYESQLAAERNELSAAESSLMEAQEQTGLVHPDAQTRSIVDTVASTRAQIGVEEARLQAMRIYATPDNPDLQRAKVEVAGLREQLAKLERSPESLGEGNVEIPTWRLPQVELEYVRRARNLKFHEALYQFLSKQAEAARLDEAGQGAIVQVIDEAKTPETRSGPHRLLIVLVTAAVAFLLACLGAMISESVQFHKQRTARLIKVLDVDS